MDPNNNIEAIVMGCSSGGISALKEIFEQMSSPCNVPIFVVHHIHKDSSNVIYDIFPSQIIMM